MTTIEDYEAARLIITIYEAEQKLIVDAMRLTIKKFIEENKLPVRLENVLRNMNVDFIYIDELFEYKYNRIIFLRYRNAGLKSLYDFKLILEEKYKWNLNN